MTYFSTPYKFGRKTKSQIDSLATSSLEIGDNVFNTDILKEEFWTGNTWINDDCVELTNSNGTSIAEGNVVAINSLILTATTGSVVLASQSEENWTIGAIYRGGNNTAKVCIAGMGFYKVKFTAGSTTTRQRIVQLTVTNGEANSTAAKTGGAGSIGVIAESYAVLPADRLVNCWINSAETF